MMPITEGSAVEGSPSQLRASPGRPTPRSSVLSAPPEGSRIQPQTMPATTTGSTWGR